MKTNITTDNYEAYLLDYMEGNLSPEEAEQLKAFVAAHGMDWDELTEGLPYLEAPQIAFEGKEKLKKEASVVPLYVKIASVAAAAGLLLTVSLWPEKSMPKVEPIANLKPIEVSHISNNEPLALLPRRAIESVDPLPRTGLRGDDMLSEVHLTSGRKAIPLLAKLPAKSINSLTSDLPLANHDEPNFDLLAYRMSINLELAQFNEFNYSDFEEEDRDLSLIGKGLFWLTNGRYDSFVSIISSGLSTAKNEISLATSDMALTAYHRVDESFEEMKENWQEKFEK